MGESNGSKAEAGTEEKKATAEEVKQAERRALEEAAKAERVRRWGGRKLSVWYIRTGVEQVDVLRNAQKAANDTGYPQRIEWIGDGADVRASAGAGKTIRDLDFVEPKRGGDGTGDRRPNWVRREMGDM